MVIAPSNAQKARSVNASKLFDKLSTRRSLTSTVKQKTFATSKKVASKINAAAKHLSFAQNNFSDFRNQVNDIGSQIKKDLPKKGHFFQRQPGMPISHTIVSDASKLSVEYR